MQPTSGDTFVAAVTGPPGPAGDVSTSQLNAAIAALKNGVDPAGDTLAELYALILLRALTDGAALTNVTVPTQAPGNNSTKAASTAFTHQEVANAAALLLSLSGGTLIGPLILNADPTSALGAATKQYVDAFIQGISNKYSALCATTTTLAANTYANGTSGVGATLTANANGALAVDGQSPASGQYVLVKNEATGANNGLYLVSQAGDSTHPYILTRAVDDDTAAEMAGAFCFVENGTVNNKTGWLCGQSAITLGTTAIVFTQFSGAGTYTAGAMLQLIGGQFSVVDPELLALGGLTSAADSVPYFTGSGTAALASLTAYARTLIAAANAAAARTVLGLGTSSTRNVGASVLDPGTGTLETVLPIQTVTGASHPFVSADFFMETRRSNAGSAMTDTFPASSATGLVNGTKITVVNVDATASDTISAGAGTTISGTGIVGPGRAIQYVYDLAGTIWRPTLNTGTALLGPNNLSDLSNTSTARANLGLGNVDNTSDATKNAAAVTLTNHSISGASNTLTAIANASLSNSTVSGVALGGTLGTLTFGTHLITGGTSYNGSAGITITSDATAANTASTIMARDGANQVAATTFTGALTGHASLDLALTGGTMSGALAMGGNNISGAAAITATSLNKVTVTAPATGATLTLIDGTVLTGPAASGTAMTLGNTETVTGAKTFNAAQFANNSFLALLDTGGGAASGFTNDAANVVKLINANNAEMRFATGFSANAAAFISCWTSTTEKARITNQGGFNLGGTAEIGAGNILAAGGITSTGALSTKKGSVAVVNGLNSNISTPVSSSTRLTGPTAVFSIGGFTGGVDGYRLAVYNTVAFAMTIKNEDASSTAGNRIKTLTGADVTLRAGTSMCELQYDATDARWILINSN